MSPILGQNEIVHDRMKRFLLWFRTLPQTVHLSHLNRPISTFGPSDFNLWTVHYQLLERSLSPLGPSDFPINHSILKTVYFLKDRPLIVKRSSTFDGPPTFLETIFGIRRKTESDEQISIFKFFSWDGLQWETLHPRRVSIAVSSWLDYAIYSDTTGCPP